MRLAGQGTAQIDAVLQTIGRIAHIFFRPSTERFAFPGRQGPHDFGRAAENHASRRYDSALGDQSIGSHDGLRADDRAVENRCAHPDEAFIVHRAGMHDRGMSNGHVPSENTGKIISEVQHRIVLHVRVLADHDAIDVTSEHSVVPHAGMRTERHVSKDDRGARDVNIWPDRWLFAEKRFELLFQIRHERTLHRLNKNKSPRAFRTRAVLDRFPPLGIPSMVTPMMVMPMAERKMKADHGAGRMVADGRADGPRVIDRRGMVNHGRGLIDGGLMDYDRLRVNDGRWTMEDDLLHWLVHDHGSLWVHYDRSGLVNHWRGLNVNGRRGIDRLRLKGPGQQEASSHAGHHFSSDCPFLIASFDAGDGTSQHCQRCCYHQGSFHNFVLLASTPSVLDYSGARQRPQPHWFKEK